MPTRFLAASLIALLALASPAAAQAPDTIYVNGRFFTGAAPEIAQGIAVAGGRITFVGTTAATKALAGPSTRVVDLGGKMVLAGFYDNHIHLGEELQPWKGGMVGQVPEWLDTDNLEKVIEGVRQQATKTPKGQWIRGELAREDWGNHRVPTRWQLDRATQDHPVAIARGPHTLLLNSAALAAAGITRDTANPPGGWIFKDEKGEPTGRVLEAARRMVTRVMPPESRRVTDDERLAIYRRQLAQLASLGITSVNVAGIRPNDFRLVQELYARWGDEIPRMTVQLRLSPGHDTYDDAEEGVRNSIAEMEAIAMHTGFGNERLKVGAIKMSIDGGLSAPVFWSLEPYKGRPGFFGAQRIPDDAFYRVAKRAHELGWQTGTHVMGDAAVKMVVDQLARILAEQPKPDHRHYLHHVAVLPPKETLDKMSKFGIMVASQPGFTVGLGAYANEALTPDREATQNPTKSLLDRGIRVSYGSDGGPYGPLVALYAGVTRRGFDDTVKGAGEAVDIRTAIKLHTLESAYQTFDEKTRGTIEVGKVADLVVLGEDILTIDPVRLREVPIDATIVGGKEIYRAAGRGTSAGR